MITGLIAFTMMQVSFAQNTVWNLDQSHSSINFAVDHLLISETTGKFTDYSMVVKSDKPDFTDAVFQLEVKTNSVHTDDKKRDEHLVSADFFDATKYPNLLFKGLKLVKVKGNNYKVYGELTMHGITKAIVLQAKFGGIIKDPWGGTRAGLKVWGEIDRYDFGLKYNSIMEAGGLSIGQMVRITCHIELIKK